MGFPQCEAATSASLSFLFASFPSLTALSLSSLPHQPHLPLPPSSLLTTLHLSSPRLPTPAFSSLSLLPSLTALTLTDAAVDDNTLLLLSTLPRLQRLGVSQCGLLTDRGVGWLIGLESAVTVDDCYAAVERYVEQRSGWHDSAWHTADPASSSFSSLSSFATLYSLSTVPSTNTASSSALPLTRPLTPTMLHDHVHTVMDHVGQLGHHSGMSMLSRSMSTPSFARHSTLTLTADETASPPPEEDDSDSDEKAGSEASSPPSPAEGEVLKAELPLYRPSAVARTLRALDVSHCHLLTDAAPLYLAYAAACMASHAACLCYTEGSAACTLLSLREVDASYCQSWSDFGIGCLATLPHLSSLSLSHSPLLTDQSLLMLQPLPFLSCLSLTHLPHLTSTSLSSLPSFLSLSHLTLSALPNLTDHSLLLLSSLPFLTHLSLQLSLTVTDVSLVSLSTSGSLVWLSVLSLVGVTSRGVFAMGRCRSLRRLEVRGCKGVTEEDKERLRHARRDMEVV